MDGSSSRHKRRPHRTRSTPRAPWQGWEWKDARVVARLPWIIVPFPAKTGKSLTAFAKERGVLPMAMQRAILADNCWREHKPPGTCVIVGKGSRSPASELRGDPLRGPCPRGANSASAVATTRVISRTDLELPPLWNHEGMGCDHARAACERITGLDSGWIPQATARPTSVQLMTSRPASIRVSPNG